MRRTVSVFASAGRRIVNVPLSDVFMPIVVPVTRTAAAAIGPCSAASTTLPVILVVPCCARAGNANPSAVSRVAPTHTALRSLTTSEITNPPLSGEPDDIRHRSAHDRSLHLSAATPPVTAHGTPDGLTRAKSESHFLIGSPPLSLRYYSRPEQCQQAVTEHPAPSRRLATTGYAPVLTVSTTTISPRCRPTPAPRPRSPPGGSISEGYCAP